MASFLAFPSGFVIASDSADYRGSPDICYEWSALCKVVLEALPFSVCTATMALNKPVQVFLSSAGILATGVVNGPQIGTADTRGARLEEQPSRGFRFRHALARLGWRPSLDVPVGPHAAVTADPLGVPHPCKSRAVFPAAPPELPTTGAATRGLRGDARLQPFPSSATAASRLWRRICGQPTSCGSRRCVSSVR